MADEIKEQIIFTSYIGTNPDDKIELLINPETLTLMWKKVLNRTRTKNRLITMFWGEEPVKFNYRGQTGYLYPKVTKGQDALIAYQNSLKEEIVRMTSYIQLLELEMKEGKGYSYDSYNGNKKEVEKLKEALSKIGSSLVSQTSLLGNLNKAYKNTEILYLSDKFKILKRLEVMYRKHQNPNDNLIRVNYRDYVFEGYFESFSYTDDAKSPWNWIYNIDFTILKWEKNEELRINEEITVITMEDRALAVNIAGQVRWDLADNSIAILEALKNANKYF